MLNTIEDVKLFIEWCKEKKKDPYGFEREKLFEEDVDELQNIMDEQ